MIKKHEFTIESLSFKIAKLKSLIPNVDDCNNYENLMIEISKIRVDNVTHDLRLKSCLALGIAMHTRAFKLSLMLIRCLT